MSYKLVFDRRALKEWRKLGDTVREQFKKKLAERLVEPHIQADKLHGRHNRYKIKLRSSGYRLVYEVNDNEIMVLVLVVGKRNGLEVYHIANQR